MATRKLVVEVVGDASQLERTFKRAGSATATFGRDVSKAERSVGLATRGAIAGSGAFHHLGRSLAFASGGYLAFAGAADLIRSSISSAEALEKAQRGLDASIARTGGNVEKLKTRYEAVAQAARRFGVDEATALTSLNRATLLTGSAAEAQRAYQEALVISKATGKDFNSVLTATAKGQEGLVGSLRRFGILVDKSTSGQAQYAKIMQRWGDQARANTSTGDVFNATLHDSEEIIGMALLPTLNRYLGELGDWLDRMNRSGRLQKDVNHIVKEAAGIFSDFGHIVKIAAGAVHQIDKLTGGFAQTLEVLVGLRLVSMISGWVGGLGTLAGAWRGVAVAAGEAAAAEGIAAGGAAPGVAGRVLQYTGGVVPVPTPTPMPGGGGVVSTLGKFGGLIARGFTLGDAGAEVHPMTTKVVDGYVWWGTTWAGKTYWTRGKYVGYDIPGVSSGGPRIPGSVIPSAFPTRAASGTGGGSGFLAGQKPIAQWAGYQLSIVEQFAQAQAALTRGTTDDVAAAKRVIARVKRVMNNGHLHGAALIQALNVEAAALSTIWSAEDAAAQKRAADAQAAKERIQAQIQDSIDPLRLEVQLSKAQAQGRPLVRILRQLRQAAQKALASGKLSLEQQKEAWDQIASLNDQLANSTAQAARQWHQINTRRITAGLHLTEQQRRELRARLAQVGPGGTVGASGPGAYGYRIGRDGHAIVEVHHTTQLDGRVVEHTVTRHQQRRRRRNSSQRRGPNAGN